MRARSALLIAATFLGAALLGLAQRDAPVEEQPWAVSWLPAANLAGGTKCSDGTAPAPRLFVPDAPYDGGTQCLTAATVLPGATNADDDVVTPASVPGFVNLVINGATSAGEPTIGVTPAGNIYFQERTRTWKSMDGGATWATTGQLPPAATTLDPLLWVDKWTGRLFVIHLYVACSQMWYSDNEGLPLSWVYNPIACGTPVNDHQKLASGPFRAPLSGGTPAYENAVYYCYNGLIYGGCALSLNGGVTFNPAMLVPCGGVLGHPHVAADGTVYSPSDHCGAFNGVGVSENNGLTWVQRTTQGTGLTAGPGLEPDVATTPDGTVYLSGVVNRPGGVVEPTVFVSTNKGVSWTARSLVGSTGVQSAVFPVVTAGANGKAAVAFHGTSCAGNPSAVGASCTWHLYVSITQDAGNTWTTVMASPAGDPTQRGSICLSGINCGADRNLLDFMDVTHDNDCRVLVAYADGCVSALCIGPSGLPAHSRSAQGVVAKQTSGPFLV
jgi:hypothetical protein